MGVPCMTCTGMQRFLLLSALIVCSLAISMSDTWIDGEVTYPYYPPIMFDTINLRTLSPEERVSSNSRIRTVTDFQRPFARRPIEEGETIISIPMSLGISEATIMNELPFLQEIAFSYDEEIFVYWLLYHKSLGTESEHYPFLQSIPTYHNCLTFKAEDWNKIIVDSNSNRCFEEAKKLKDSLKAAHTLVDVKANQLPPESGEILMKLTRNTNIPDYIQAFLTVTDMLQKTPKGLMLFPAIRFSHSPSVNKLEYVGETVQLIASVDIAPGEEIFMNYGDVSNGELLVKHAIFMEANPRDCIPFSYSVESMYWSLIMASEIGQQGKRYTSCLPANFQPRSEALKIMRTTVATKEQLKNVSSILAGNSVSLENEARMLHTLLDVISKQTNTPPEAQPDPEGNLSLELWQMYNADHQATKQKVLDRILELWLLYL